MSFTQNNISNNNNMTIQAELKNLIEKDIAENGKKSYHPVQLVKGGKYTKKALAFNRKMLKEGKITGYLDKNKFWNADTGRIVSAPIDKRYKTPTVKKGFKNDFNVVGQTFATKKPIKSFRYVADDVLSPSWTVSDDSLYSNDLLRQLIKNNNISGNQRIIIKKNNDVLIDQVYNITNATSFWKSHKMDFQVDSEFMIWNDDLNEGDVVHIIFTKEKKLPKKYFKQSFLDGKLSHCVLQPILNWVESVIENSQSDSTIKKYSAMKTKIVGKVSEDKKGRYKDKIGYIQKYKDGVPEADLPALCEDLQIGMNIDQPFSNSTLLFEYRSTRKPLKVFRYINTRLNHIEFDEDLKVVNENSVFKCFEPEKVADLQVLKNIQKELDDNQDFYIYSKNSYGINSIQTLDKYYKIESPFSDTVQEWEKYTGLKYCAVDARKYPELHKFINSGTHFNGTIDFKDTYDFKNVNLRPKDLKHIDMTKAYTQFKQCKWYDGFCLKITDFRKTSKIQGNGLYYIDDLDLSGCSKKFVKLNQTLYWFIDQNVYTKEELDCLSSYGAKYNIKYGCWGLKEEFEFNEKMINEKDVIVFDEKEIKVPYYSKWAGMNCMIRDNKNFWCKGDERFFQNINTDADIYFADDEARISYRNKYQFNKKHITAQITAYQRLQMLDQLMVMDLNKIIRICCDGIYFHDHKFEMYKVFSEKEKVTFNNDSCESYLSGLINDGEMDFQCIAEPREHYKSQIFDGAGGDGKTYGNLFIDQGFINVVYAPHSNKLESAMYKLYKQHFDKKLAVTNHHRLLNEPFSTVDGEVYRNNVYIIDECSMLTEHQKDYLLTNIRGKIIFCGDLKCQCDPVSQGEQMTYKNINNIAPPSKKNYRFKDDTQLNTCNYLRDCIINKKSFNLKKLPYQKVNKEFVKKNYSKEDIILVSEHKFNDEWSNTFKDLEKYRVKNNTRDYKNGDIVFEKMKNVQTELRHGFTIHSVQGETFKNKIFIDMRKMKSKKIFYTAISRAEYSQQIYLII